MGLFDFFKQNDINHGIEQFKNSKGAILVDVRTPEEYSEGHIPKSVNIPLRPFIWQRQKLRIRTESFLCTVIPVREAHRLQTFSNKWVIPMKIISAVFQDTEARWKDK